MQTPWGNVKSKIRKTPIVDNLWKSAKPPSAQWAWLPASMIAEGWGCYARIADDENNF